MATSIYLKLNEKRKRKDNSYPIVFEIIHNRKNTQISTGFAVLKTNWNMKNNLVKKDCITVPYSKIVNQKLHERLGEMMKIIAESNPATLNSMSVTDLKGLLHSLKKRNISFVDYANNLIKSLKKEDKINSARLFQETLNFLIKATKHKALPFSMINVKMLNRLETTYMKVPNNHYNGLSVHLRCIRNIYNKAISDNIVPESTYPFRRSSHDKDKYKIKTEKTKKRAISKDLIIELEEFAQNTENQILKKHIKIFLFSFYMRGMNFTDIAKLKKSSVINDTYLQFRRSKTKREFVIKIGEKAWNILHYFEFSNKLNSDYLFPIIKHETSELVTKDIRNGTQNTNKYLKQISRELKLSINLTTYVSRHSWATIADKAGIDRHIISKGLGHADLQTTNIYIDDIVSNDDLLEADDIITG